MNPTTYLVGLNTLTLGLLWLKVLGFLKVVNKQTATFILALFQILKDLRHFAIVLAVVIFMFGDMVCAVMLVLMTVPSHILNSTILR